MELTRASPDGASARHAGGDRAIAAVVLGRGRRRQQVVLLNTKPSCSRRKRVRAGAGAEVADARRATR